MVPGGRTRRSLAAQVVRLTLIIGAATIVVAIVVAIISTSRLTADAARQRDLRAIQIVEDRIEHHLRTLSAELEQAITPSRGPDFLVQRLIALEESRPGSFEQVIIANRRGQVLAVVPKMRHAVKNVRREPAYLSAIAGRAGFVSDLRGAGNWDLWITRTTIDPSGEPIIILARVDTSFVDVILKNATAGLPHRAILLMDQTRVVAARWSDEQVAMGQARWSVEGPQWGTVRVASGSGDFLQGHYNDIGGLEGVGWRTVIVAPASEQAVDTLRTITPPMLVLLAGGTIALAAAWGLSLRLSRPLRYLERAALAAASGSYVRPLSTERDDEVGRVAEAFNAVALRLNALHDLSQLLASASNIDQVLDGIVSAVGHLVGPGSVAVYLLDDESTTLRPVRTVGAELATAQPVPIDGDGWLARAVRTGEPGAYEGSPEGLAVEVPGITGGHVASYAAPLMAGRVALGVVVVVRDASDPISDAESEMLRTFSAQAAVATQTSRLFEHEIASRRNAEALRSVAEELVRPTSLQSALNTVEHVVSDLFLARDAIIAVVDRSSLGIAASSSVEIERQIIEVAQERLHQAKGPGPWLVSEGESPQVDGLLGALSARSVLLVPIGLDGDHGAVLAVSTGPNALPSNASEFARALGDEIELALDNAYFFQRALSRAANLETIFSISQAVGSSLQTKVVLSRVLDVVQKILSADAVALLSYDVRKRALTTTMGRGLLPGHLLHLEVQPGHDIPGEVFSRGEPVLLRGLASAPGGVAKIAAEDGLASLLAVPLLARGRSIGVLMVFSKQPIAFAEEDMNTLQTFASQAALAIDTARLYSREHEVASVLQQSILPDELPDFDEVEAGSVYAPAGGDIEIGGDYYDLFKGKDGRVWFSIADVCGKGVHAATKTSMIKYAVRAFAIAGMSPSQIVLEINNMIAESDDPSDIVTLWVGRYEHGKGAITWANGGHPPGLLRHIDGTFSMLDVTGPLLGAIPDATYEERTMPIAVGELVLLYTDGVSEARRGNIFYGDDRVKTVLAREASAAQAARDVLASVQEYTRNELRDDVAVLAIRIKDVHHRPEAWDGR